MPGSYAHITLVNEASEKRRLKKIKGFPAEAIRAMNLQSRFLELGSISPDYPYLDLTSGDSKHWADAMHYTHTCKAINIGAELVRALPSGTGKMKCLSWLMGYTAHVYTDMFVHPIIELKVGPYAENSTAHRRCEMHQDAYISRRLGTGMPQIADHIQASILRCHAKGDPTQLDPDVKRLWEQLLQKVYPVQYNDDPPEMNTWHNKCHEILQKLLPTSSNLVGFARHVCDGLGFSYPTPAEINMEEYLEKLLVPSPEGEERRMHYDEIFNGAIECVQKGWLDVSSYAVGQGDLLAFRDQEWNLDTGRDETDSTNKVIFWEVA
jgi:hypothetical protein